MKRITMKSINIFFYSISIIFFQLNYAAADAQRAQWLKCVKAIQEGDGNAFEQSFSRDLLPVHSFIGCGGSIRPIALIHIAALSKAPDATRIMERLLSEGSDPNSIRSFPCERVVETDTSEQSSVQYSRGLARTLTPLDIAIVVGNVPIVRTLLRHSADPYNTALLSQTSIFAACIKILLCKCSDEDPLTHARDYLERVKEANRTLTPIEGAHGTQEEYTEIIKLLEQAQRTVDLEDIGKCPCAIL